MIARFIRAIIHHLGNLLRKGHRQYLRATGVRIGTGGMISLRARLDVRRGAIIIGDNCTITSGCIILSHDASARVIDPEDDGYGRVIIKDNVFIGVNSVILRNVTIGENAIIGAGSVVSRDIPPNVVAVGNPARVSRELRRHPTGKPLSK